MLNVIKANCHCNFSLNISVMDRIFIYAVIGIVICGNVRAGAKDADHSWTSINCHEFELVADNTGNYTSDEIRLHAAGSFDPHEPDSRNEQCFAIKMFSQDDREFDNYGISVSMLHVRSENNPDNFGKFGLVFNYQDKFNYDYVYIR